MKQNLHYTIHTSSQYETVYVDDKPVLTIQRKRHNEHHQPYWRVFATDGTCVISLFLNNQTYLFKRITRYLTEQGYDLEASNPEQHIRGEM